MFGPLDETEDYKSARDKDGHGSHMASIVAGRTVPNVTGYGGFAGGTASGAASLARLAIYKPCWPYKAHPLDQGNFCEDIDIAAAFDDAMGDGVDIISISFGMDEAQDFGRDWLARGALHALKNNIVVVASAGNAGPSPHSVTNPAPWLLTVGASRIDRSFPAPIVLVNGSRIQVT